MSEAAANLSTEPLTDSWAAARFAGRYALRFRVVQPSRRWLVWTGSRWAAADTGEPERAAIENARYMFVEAGDPGLSQARATALAKFAIRSQSRSSIEAVLRLAAVQEEFVVRAEDLDRNPFLLGTPSGSVDLLTGQIREAERRDLLTKQTAAPYVADATCPRWEAFLARMLPSPESRAFFQRAAGYSLTGDTAEHALFFLYGLPATGKSTALGVLQRIWGDYARTAPTGMLVNTRHEQHPTAVAGLAGCRLAIAIEIGQGRSWDTALLNQLTGGDRVTARRMREDFWEFASTHKIWIGANYRPHVPSTNDGIWRRMRIVPFDVVIPESDQERNLADKLVAAEGSGILRWAVQGCLAWRRDGLGEPPEVREATDTYREDEDRIGEFVAERCVLDPRARITRKDMYVAYSEWNKAAGERWSLSERELAGELRARPGISESKTNGKRGWKGIGLQRRESAEGAPGAGQGQELPYES